MMSITNSKLFEELSEFVFNGERINLHDDFECTEIQFNKDLGLLAFHFSNVEGMKDVELKFYSARLSTLTISLPLNINASTLESFYRGRFEQDGKLYETTKENECFYYLEFNEGITINLFAKEVIVDF